MRLASALLPLLLLAPVAAAEEQTVPSLELLEFLAEMEQNDNDWRDVFHAMLDDSDDSDNPQEDENDD